MVSGQAEFGLGLLGAFEVTVGGKTLPIGSLKQRVVLAMLVLDLNRVVTADRLVAELWGDHPPVSVTGTLQSLVSRLRRLLADTAGPTGVALQSRNGGWVLEADPDRVDAVRFERLAAKGREALGRGEFAPAAAAFDDGLTLWRGPALADLADRPFAEAVAARLDEARVDVVEDLAEAELGLDRAADALRRLEHQVAAHPLRERAWGHLMVALYRLGRQADALRAYQRLRRLLAEELGLEPTPSLRQLEERILRHSPDLDGAQRRLVWDALAASPIPLPPLLTEIGRIFVGREGELACLRSAALRSAGGAAGCVLVAGEPGIGKTRLAAEIARDLHSQGTTVLAGRCSEDSGLPYQPVVEALRHSLQRRPPVFGRFPEELARLVPEIRHIVPGLPAELHADPETEQYRLFDSLSSWLSDLTADVPALLIVDDLQWAAPPTLSLLRHLLAPSGGARLLVVAAYRDTDVEAADPLAAFLADVRRAGATMIALSGLDAAAVSTFVEIASGAPLEAAGTALAHALWTETSGNPLFVSEMLRHLAESDGLTCSAGGGTTSGNLAPFGIPDGIRDLVGLRLARVGDATRRALTTAAVAGLEFETGVVGVASGLDEEAFLGALDEALAARLIADVPGPLPRCRFSHSLVKDAVYQGLGGARRATLHRRVAQAIEGTHDGALGGSLASLAYHWSRAATTPALLRLAAGYASRAGEAALTQLAHEEAATYFGQALDLLDGAGTTTAECPPGPPGTSVELLIHLGEAQRRAGDPAHRETLLEAGRAARLAGDADAEARAALANQRGFFSRMGAVDHDRVAALRHALEAQGTLRPATHARLLACLAAELHYCGDDQPLQVGREAVAVARAAGDPAALGEVLAGAWFVLRARLPMPERAALAAELARAAGEAGDPILGFHAATAGYLTACEEGDMAQAAPALAELSRIADELGRPLLRWRAACLSGISAMATGRLDEVERVVGECQRLGEATGQPDAAAYSQPLLCVLRFVQGDADAALGMVESLVARFPGAVGFRCARAWFLAETGRLVESRAQVVSVRDPDFTSIPREYNWMGTMSMLSRAVAVLDEPVWAEEVYDLLVPHDPLMVMGQSVWFGPLAHELGLLATRLARWDDAERHFGDAADAQARMGASATLVHTRLAWAQMLLARRLPGDRERAGVLLAEARKAAESLNLPRLLGRLAGDGGSPARERRTFVGTASVPPAGDTRTAGV